MPPKTVVHKNLNHYYKILSRSNDRIACPLCKIAMSPRLFEKHCLSRHDVDGKSSCVWCRQFSWAKGEKRNNASHLIRCFREFSSPRNSSTQSYHLATMAHAHEEKDFYGHSISFCDPTVIDYIWPFDPDLSPAVTFSDRNLNLAASHVRKYLKTKDTHDWIHVMVKAKASESFARAIKEDGGSSRTLEFSCWCDGGRHKEARHRQHRHAIVVCTPKGRFEKEVWPKVEVPREDRPHPNFACKRMKRILTPLHLVNTMGYLSHRKSRCKFSFKKQKKSLPSQSNHFYIYKTLPKNFKLHLVQFWKGGIEQLLYQTKFQNVSVSRVAEGAMTHAGGRWQQKIKEFYGHERGLVLNVSKRFAPTDRPTPFFFYLTEDRKLYFESSQENEALDERAWLRKQAEGGNCFYDAVEETTWIPRKRDQRVLNFYKPVWDRKKQLEADLKNERIKTESKLTNKKMEVASLKRKNNEFEKENVSLKRKMNQLEAENVSLKRKRLEIEILRLGQLQREARLNNRVESQQMKIAELNDRIESYQSGIIKSQKEENAKLKSENERLKNV